MAHQPNQPKYIYFEIIKFDFVWCLVAEEQDTLQAQSIQYQQQKRDPDNQENAANVGS